MSVVGERTPLARSARRWIPGETGVWLLVFADMTFFMCIFGTFMYERGQLTDVFNTSRAALEIAWGAVNTFILLTSSLVVAMAVRCVRGGELKLASRLVTVGAGLGLWFIVNKAIEWGTELHAGHAPKDNVFFQMYFVSTGAHLLHVIVGVGVLLYLRHAILRGLRRDGVTTPVLLRNVESGAVYWHMVDLLWVVLFALIYLAV